MVVDTILNCDALELCSTLEPASIDLILADLPYGGGKTKAKWDRALPLARLWDAFRRIVKQDSAIVLTASQPFASMLAQSNLGWYRYSWYWHKARGANIGHSNHQPMQVIEEILVFSPMRAAGNQFTQETMRYYPQREKFAKPYTRDYDDRFDKSKSAAISTRHGKVTRTESAPKNILYYAMDSDPDRGLHPTQKPISLFEYLIETYTQPGDLVFDPTCGSGTTAVAARKIGRHYICGDSGVDDKTGKPWAVIAQDRLTNSDPYQNRELKPGIVQQTLFQSDER
jgi:site-specific DNA-methyltransferase (adenine-specific)